MKVVERQLESNLVEHTPQYENEMKSLGNNIVETTFSNYETINFLV